MSLVHADVATDKKIWSLLLAAILIQPFSLVAYIRLLPDGTFFAILILVVYSLESLPLGYGLFKLGWMKRNLAIGLTVMGMVVRGLLLVALISAIRSFT